MRRNRKYLSTTAQSPAIRHIKVSSVTAWQVSTLAVLALRAGCRWAGGGPAGVGAVRHRPWYRRVGALIPAMVVLVIVLAVLLAADAAGPGRAAARLQPAGILRTG